MITDLQKYAVTLQVIFIQGDLNLLLKEVVWSRKYEYKVFRFVVVSELLIFYDDTALLL
jgi:hypothetical protein